MVYKEFASYVILTFISEDYTHEIVGIKS